MFILITIGVLLGLAAIFGGIVRALPFGSQRRVLNALHAAWQWCWRNGQELVGLPVAMLLFWLSGPMLRWLEPNSAIYDAGVLQGITVVICHLLVGNSIARMGARINIVWFQRNTSASIVSREWLFIIYFFGYCLLAALI